MNFEIAGVWPSNKGSVLMLEAIKARLGCEFPNARFAVPLSWPPEARLALGLWGTPDRIPRRLGVRSLIEAASQSIRQKVNVLPSQEIDVLLDTSGFAYGDHWGVQKLQQRLGQRLSTWKGPDRRAILLPQALGPFKRPGMAKAFRTAMDHLDLAFVRDRVSDEYVSAVVRTEHRSKLSRAPDFTNLLNPPLPSQLSELRGLSAVIPNEKLVTGRPPEARSNYLRFLALTISSLRRSGREPFILVHEGALDRQIAAEVNALLDRRVRVVEDASSLVTKSVIAAADLVISSRYHGLVSALSSGVPSLACGWSHKYAELMADYGCPEAMVDIENPSSWSMVLEDFLASAREPKLRAHIAERAAVEKAKSERMWDDALQVIRSRN